MPYSSLMKYVREVLHRVPMEHWVVMAAVALAVALLFGIRKKYSVYGAIVLGLAVMMGLFLLDAAVVNRFGIQLEQHPELNLRAEYERLFHGTEAHYIQLFTNVVVFVPFGFFVSEFLSVTRRCSAGRCLGIATLFGFLLSSIMELCQRFFRVGLFELTDLAMNTIGAIVGVLLSLCLRRLVVRKKGV